MSTNDKTTRRGLFAILPGLGLLLAGTAARSAGTMPKANVKYQDHPSGAAQCSKCAYFIAGANATAPGQCKVVAGPVAANAWCVLYAPKPH